MATGPGRKRGCRTRSLWPHYSVCCPKKKEKKYEFFVLDNRGVIFYNVTYKSNEGKKTRIARSESRWMV